MHFQMLFWCFENPIGRRCLNWFQSVKNVLSVVDVAIRKRSNNLLCVESEPHKTSEILVEINRTPYLMGN